MKKFLSFVFVLVCATSVVLASKIEPSVKLPAEGGPEHIYTM